MLLTILSEGVLIYHVTVKDPTTGKFVVETIRKNGPITSLLTTASDVDHQVKTRSLPQTTDESGTQTVAIVKDILTKRRKRKKQLNLQLWIDFQLLLEMDAPYRVDIPFGEAIFAAFMKWRPKFLETASIRMRRDLNSFLRAVETSAVIHKFQRKTDEDGEIVAILDDYKHAYNAFDAELATVYGAADEKVIATVEAIEAMLAAQDSDLPDPVKATLRELAKRDGDLRPASVK
jgi:hypothetical protein